MGRLIQKIQRQSTAAAMAPPATGPAISAIPVMPLSIPSALPRCSRGKAAPRAGWG